MAIIILPTMLTFPMLTYLKASTYIATITEIVKFLQVMSEMLPKKYV